MRLHRCVPALAAVVTLAGASAPAAYAADAIAPGGGGTVPAATPVAQHHPAGSVDLLIGIGTATGIAVLGTGAAATLRNRRPVAGTRAAR